MQRERLARCATKRPIFISDEDFREMGRKRASRTNIGDAVFIKNLLKFIFARILDVVRSNKKTYKNEDIIKFAEIGDLGAIKRLLKSGADVNTADDDTGFTPLHYSVCNNCDDLTKFLIEEANADVLIRTNENLLPSDLAFTVARNDSIGDYLISLESAERDRRGVAFSDNIQSGLDPNP
ncbi:ankyrin repeat domain-containing protein [Maricaulis alexandrii]|uniref:ankyrin repeat domain-containing protein n=1 Tax=Maricaulis alexandrii TaxID=2570354 RepID=UPI001108649A|nr:ankyrin repeat domain-containing protein [Maricaulis alexandrii]